ncbi:amyloid beta precursor protein binding family B member 2-like isoform X3 [Lineus longissimus]|uniref:amyloid beta precursor protein binding family B member 2-like isoform X3 n=1 Tax=Lineus longissimus TaxID=88925 RepID=UPI002B4F4D11
MTLQNRSYLIAKARYLRLSRKLNAHANHLNNMFANGTMYRNMRRWEHCWDLDNNPAYINDNPFQQVEDNEMITSFSNPNYHMNDDELNSNITPLTTPITPTTHQYYQDQIYADPDILTSSRNPTSKRRKNYAQLDLTSMGIDLNSEQRNYDQQNICSPDSLCSVDSAKSEEFVDCDNEPQQNDDNSEESDVEEQEVSTPYAEKSSFLGYYASLEKSAKSQQERQPRGDVRTVEQQKVKEVKSTETQNGKSEIQKDADSKKDSEIPEGFTDKTCINSPDSNDSGIQADEGQIRGSASVESFSTKEKKESNTEQSLTEGDANTKVDDELPAGWEKHEDEQTGVYFWHVKSGTIQREPPTKSQRPLSIASDISLSSLQSTLTSPTSTIPDTPSSCASGLDQDHLSEFEGHAFKYASESLKSLYTPTEESEGVPFEEEKKKVSKPIRYAVRSLGWVRIAEEDLTPERSSKAVNKCIVDLSLGRNDINDVVGRWGDGKDLFMDLDNNSLTLSDPTDFSVLHRQPIQSIRVWGVGRDNGRDFAYVARDRSTRKHMCHVFRCDTPARHIANTLRDICKKLMMERSMKHGAYGDAYDHGAAIHRSIRPNNLPNLDKNVEPNGQKITFQNVYKKTSFPTPMEEPKKVIRCHYLGTTKVAKPTGVDIINNAMEKLYKTIPVDEWQFCNVAVAPSTITITEHGKPENQINECRVRFLSFMGIAMHNVKLCSYIMHTAQDAYIAHVFHCEPSAGALCKTIEAACKLRYQKCLDAHPSTPDKKQQQQTKRGATKCRKV